MKLKEDKYGRVFVKGLKEILVTSVEEGHKVLRKGFKNRQVSKMKKTCFILPHSVLLLLIAVVFFFALQYFIQVANTLLNQDSSRSHSVITFKLVQISNEHDKAALQRDPSLIKYSKLSIIDLAGSERNARTKTTGARLKEAGK